MRHLYKVQFGVKWAAKGRRSYWDDDNIMNVVANGDAKKAIRKVERKAKSMILDDSALEGGAIWRASAFRLISVDQSVEVTS